MINSFLSWMPDTWLDYLLLYSMPGGLMAIYYVINTWREKPSEFARGLSRAIGKEVSSVDKLKELLVYVIALSCVIFGWPGFVVWYFKNQKAEAANLAWQALPDFNCAPQYLVNQVNPVDAEIASYVIDPLGTVPSLPFGHLNKGWVNFLADLTDDGDQLWSFYIPKGSKTGKYQFECSSDIRGYAKVRDGKILSEFITESD